MARMTRGDRPADEAASKREQEPSPVAAPVDDSAELKKKLLTRAVVAAVLVAALLAVLAVFDALNAPPPKVAGPAKPQVAKQEEAATEEAKAEPAKPSGAEGGSEKLASAAEAKKPEEGAAEPEKSAAPTTPAARPEKPLTKPAQARPAMMKPSEPAHAAKRVEPGPLAAAPRAPHTGAPASRPLTRMAEAMRGFVLQLGVFNNTANAEELRAKLELHGIPSQIEARVQVGPFKTREEVEAAREKLRALGMEPGILVAIKK